MAIGGHPVFVYGTLKKGYSNFNRILKSRVYDIKVAKALGKIYNLGAFPCFVEKESGIVYGELMFIKSLLYDDTIRELDYLEGYREENKYGNLYVRKLINVKDDKNIRHKAWIYVWNKEVPENLLIKNGIWRGYYEPVTNV
jgi:gamma-glutamylcyclotransferase (GGCT)/AIG2-like uncharacterized protein YtfP